MDQNLSRSYSKNLSRSALFISIFLNDRHMQIMVSHRLIVGVLLTCLNNINDLYLIISHSLYIMCFILTYCKIFCQFISKMMHVMYHFYKKNIIK